MTLCPPPLFKIGDKICFNSCAKPNDCKIITEKGHSVRWKKQNQTKYEKDTKNPVLLKYGVFQAL